MTESLRELLYPLGFLAALMFAGRFLIQWISSEMHKKSMLPQSFWWLSLTGNILLFLHAWIQLQYHVFVVQGCNAVISWRNLNLMGPREKRVRLRTVVKLLIASIVISTAIFYFQSGEWFRIPRVPFMDNPTTVSNIWHLMGFAGILLFASRFWVQWFFAELHQRSYLGKPFWWLSLVGDLLMIAYFYKLGDPANLVGPLLGLIPYIRNLMLLRTEPL